MITPMKKVTVLCLQSMKNETTETLCKFGIMHVIPLQAPSGSAVTEAKTAMTRVSKALESLPEKAAKGPPVTEDGHTLVSQIHSLLIKRKGAEDTLLQTKQELDKFSAFENFSPAEIHGLETRGIYIRLYQTEKGQKPEAEDGAFIQDFGRNRNGHHFAVLNYGTAPVKVTNATALGFPSTSLADLRKKLRKSEKELQRCESGLALISSEKGRVKNVLVEATDEFHFREASAGMIEGAGISMIQGYCPTPRLDELRKAAPGMGWGLKIEDPSEEDNVPTLLNLRKPVKPIEFLYDIIGIAPGYREVDVSAVFLLFFSIFFAMIVGDAVYGLLFLGITLLARKKHPDAPAAGFHFMEIMSVATIIWGVISADYLGFSPAFLDLVQISWTPEWLKEALAWTRESANVQYICFWIAVVHLTIAHVWNFTVKLREKSTTAIAQIGWLCTTWVMFLLAGFMVLNKPLPSFTVKLFAFGAILILLFRVPPKRLKQDWISIPMLVLDLVSNFVDVVSYIRLFAVGMAGVAIAQAFNTMLSPLFGSFFGILAAAAILFFVHALNIALGIMGVAVHAIRLNTLEFSNHMELQWSGYNFDPLSRHKSH